MPDEDSRLGSRPGWFQNPDSAGSQAWLGCSYHSRQQRAPQARVWVWGTPAWHPENRAQEKAGVEGGGG